MTPEEEQNALQIAATTSSALSITGDLAVLVAYYLKPKREQKELGNRMVMILAALDVVRCVALVFGTKFVPDADQEEPSPSCVAQGFFVQFGLSVLLWNAVMALNFRFLVVAATPAKRLRRLLKYELGAVMILSAVLAFTALGFDLYGAAGLWCFIASEYPFAQIGFYYVAAFISWVICIVCVVEIDKTEHIPLLVAGNDEEPQTPRSNSVRLHAAAAAKASTAAVRSRLLKYTIVFTIITSFRLANRLHNAICDETGCGPSFALEMMQSILSPLQGFLFALIFFGVSDELVAKCRCCMNTTSLRARSLETEYDLNDETTRHATRGGWRSDDLVSTVTAKAQLVSEIELKYIAQSDTDHSWPKGPAPAQRSVTNEAKARMIFASTFNVGECALGPEHVAAWLPRGYDLYAIAVQECLQPVELRAYMMDHLNEGRSPGEYVLFTSEIGSTNTQLGFHGMIALTVIGRQSEVDAGHLVVETRPVSALMPLGRQLVGGLRAPNKGGCAVGVVYYNTPLAFVSAHLQSDSGGKLRFGARNKHAQELLAGTNVSRDDLGCDLHFSHHHTFVLGDLNYRIADFTNPEEVLDIMHKCAVANRAALSEGSASRQNNEWRTARWNDIGNRKFSTKKQLGDAAACWEPLTAHDELGRARQCGGAFYGFDEAPISFPPSFRRQRGVAGNCGDYSDRALLGSAFVTDLSKAAMAEAEDEDEDIDESVRAQELAMSVIGVKTSLGEIEVAEFKKLVESDNLSPLESLRLDELLRASNVGFSDRSRVDDPVIPGRSKHARPPSFTDRVLVHSLRDVKARLELAAYDTTDAIDVSDHRPVALAAILTDNSDSNSKSSSDTAVPVWVRLSSPRFLERLEGAKETEHRLQQELYSTPYYATRVKKRVTEAGSRVYPTKQPRNYQVATRSNKQEGGSGDAEDGDGDNINTDYSGLGELTSLELVFPIPTEDPLSSLRSGFGAAAEAVPISAWARRRKERPIVFARVGNPAGEGNVSLSNQEVLEATTTVSRDAFFALGGVLETVSDVFPKKGMHAVLRLLDREGEALAQGYVCLAEVAAAHMREQDQLQQTTQGDLFFVDKSNSHSDEERDRGSPDPVNVVVDLSFGGQKRGCLAIAVTVERVHRVE